MRKKSYLKVTVQEVKPNVRKPVWSTSYLITRKKTAVYGRSNRKKEIEQLLGLGTKLLGFSDEDH